MECNKDEAIRAKGIAEDRMRKNDFEGARKVALKAQNLYPELENISQMLSICDVHCSAQQSFMGVDKDWYGILQVQRLADEGTIRKQYRRLALILHPDKNRFPGAESAFKLISEANAVLSDAAKKTLYDNKIRVSVRSLSEKPATHKSKINVQVNSQFSAQRNVATGHSNMNQHKAKGSSSSIKEDVFWTACPNCKIKYQYHRQFVNRSLRCPSCLKPYMACEIHFQGVSGTKSQQGSTAPSRHGSANSFAFQRKAEPTHGPSKVNVQVSQGFSAPCVGQQGIPSNKAQTDSMDGRKVGIANGDASGRESGDLNGKSSKRGRKQGVESSESFDASIDAELDDVANKHIFGDPETGRSRRLKRSKQNISYNESDDDLNTSLKSLKRQKTTHETDDNLKDVPKGECLKNENQNGIPADATYSRPESKEPGAVLPEEKLQGKDTKCDKKEKAKGEAGFMAGTGKEQVDIKIEPALGGDDLKKDRCVLPDTDFHDFEKGRDANLFKVDQHWALYDPSDGMPRFYAKVKKTSVSPFEVRITWLEATPINNSFENWVNNVLPVGCGTFKFGTNDKIFEPSMFSHEVKEVQKIVHSRKRCSLNIYPRKGEVWVLFKDWDANWSLDPENHRKLKYEIVEVMSDFDQGTGIRVGYLDKVEGFVSLFQRTVQSDADSFVIGPDQVYKFSHCVPSFEMTGSEREGVPKGSFELDPASLPSDPDDLHFPVKAKIVSPVTNAEIHRSSPKSTKKGAKSVGPVSEPPSAPKESAKEAVKSVGPASELPTAAKTASPLANAEIHRSSPKSTKKGAKSVGPASEPPSVPKESGKEAAKSVGPASELPTAPKCTVRADRMSTLRRSSRGSNNTIKS